MKTYTKETLIEELLRIRDMVGYLVDDKVMLQCREHS